MNTLCIFEGNSHQEALSVKEILEFNDILTIMPNEHISSVMPFYSLPTGGFSLYVSNTQFVEAAELLHSLNIKIQNNELLENLETLQKEKQLETCPHCGNNSVETQLETRKGLIVLIFLFFGVPIHAKKAVKKCHICNTIIK